MGKGRREGASALLAWIPVSPTLTSSPSLSQQRKKNPHEVVYNVSRGGGIFFLGNLGGEGWRRALDKGLAPCSVVFA